MKDALSYDINNLKEKQIISLSKILTDLIDENKEYYNDKDYVKEIMKTINSYLEKEER